jgi:uncharacterized protein with von Willebrand factor type A (vWA) domain
MAKPLPGDLSLQVARFCRALREAGLPVAPDGTAAALTALTAIDLGDRQEFFYALRLSLCRSPEWRERFAQLFEAYFGMGALAQPAAPLPFQQPKPAVALNLLDWGGRAETEALEEASTRGLSLAEALREVDFSRLPPDAEPEVLAAARRIARRLATHVGRRYRIGRKGERPALRAILRQSLATGGELAALRFMRRRRRRVRLLVICDVSGSMELYSRFLLQVVYGLQRYLSGVESFAFSTQLHRIGREIRQGRFAEAIRRAAAGGRWGGGTRIGESLLALRQYRLPAEPVALILSDGWDAGDPDLLREAMADLKRRCRRVIWLNPLLGSPDYQPLTRGMQAALPYIDIFAPCHNLHSLEELPRYLRRSWRANSLPEVRT